MHPITTRFVVRTIANFMGTLLGVPAIPSRHPCLTHRYFTLSPATSSSRALEQAAEKPA
jgi:hypothetical protein